MSKYNSVLELYGYHNQKDGNWNDIVEDAHCPFLSSKCKKTRKSSPDKTIGTCTVKYSKEQKNMCICPHRMLEKDLVFRDCIDHMSEHHPDNDLHLTDEVGIQGGSVDYFLLSVDKSGLKTSVSDFVGIELQALDSTGTVWPSRQELVNRKTNLVEDKEVEDKSFGMNWKMTAKTSLVQMHHKVETFDVLDRHLVLVVQDHLLNYMRNKFSFSHFEERKEENPLHIHSYSFDEGKDKNGKPSVYMNLDETVSTDIKGVESALGMREEVKVDEDDVLAKLENNISGKTISE